MEQALNDVASITNTAATQYVLPANPLPNPNMVERERGPESLHMSTRPCIASVSVQPRFLDFFSKGSRYWRT
jgi:hypothetical protein